ncbi:MAG: PilZ domain-containing protein [Gammaproteobacteria bacterium]|nr:PilZ domain-containing protein [Gammaproteobacteria bacterium]
MSFERRSHPRYALTLPVIVFHEGIPVDIGWTQDVSEGGMRIAEVALDLERNTRVTLWIDSRHRGVRCHVPAIVRHTFDEGVGVWFVEPDRTHLNGLRAVLPD